MRKTYIINERYTLIWHPKTADCVSNGKNWMVTEEIDGLDYCLGFYATKREALDSVR